MWLRNPITRFSGIFVLVFILLILPWPGWAGAYGVWFRMLGRTIYSASETSQRGLSFGRLGEKENPNPGEMRHPDYTRIVITNRAADTACDLVVDPITFGWRQTALLIALIVATPVSWRRRRWALLWGLICIHIIILAFLGFSIWNQSTVVALVTLGPFWKNVADGIQEFVLSQFSAVMPVLIWLLVTFRKDDRLLSVCLSLFGPAQGEPAKSEVKAAVRAEKQARK